MLDVSLRKGDVAEFSFALPTLYCGNHMTARV